MKNKLLNKIFIVFTIILSFVFILPKNTLAIENNFVNIYVFYDQYCVNCEKELNYLENNFSAKYGSKVKIYKYEISYNEDNANKFDHIRNNILTFEGNSIPLPL